MTSIETKRHKEKADRYRALMAEAKKLRDDLLLAGYSITEDNFTGGIHIKKKVEVSL